MAASRLGRRLVAVLPAMEAALMRFGEGDASATKAREAPVRDLPRGESSGLWDGEAGARLDVADPVAVGPAEVPAAGVEGVRLWFWPWLWLWL